MGLGYFKCDLHIHSDLSNTTKGNDYSGQFSLDELLNQLNKPENDVKMFSITDHNDINVSLYEDYFNRFNDDTNRLLLLGIEFDIHLEQNLFESIHNLRMGNETTNKKYHSLIIFKTNDIHKIKKCLEAMYSQIQNEFNATSPYSDLDISDGDRVLDFFNYDIKHRLTSIDRIIKAFQGEVFLVISHGNKSSNIVEAYNGNITEAQAMILLGVINSVEMSPKKSDAILHFNKGFDSILNGEYRNRDDVPYVVFSDNHELAAYPHYKKSQMVPDRPFTWMRGELSFETLRLSFVDPSSRIVLSNEKPMIPAKYLESISFDLVGQDETLSPVNITLSPGINTIIGGRSSGKSLLLNAILANINTSSEYSQISNYSESDNKLLSIDSITGKMNFEPESKAINSVDTHAYTQEMIVNKFDKNGEGLETVLQFQKFENATLRANVGKEFLYLDNVALFFSDCMKYKHDYSAKILYADIKESVQNRSMTYDYSAGIASIKEKITEPIDSLNNKLEEVTKTSEGLSTICEYKNGEDNLFSIEEKAILKDTIKILKRKEDLLSLTITKFSFMESFLKKIDAQIPALERKILSDEDAKINAASARIKLELEKNRNYIKSRLALKNAVNKLNGMSYKEEYLERSISDTYSLRTEINFKLDINTFNTYMDSKIASFDSNNIYDSLIAMVTGNNVKIRRLENNADNFNILISKFKDEVGNKMTPRYTIIEKGEIREISSEHMSPGKKASVFLEIILNELNETDQPFILIIDQPEDNLDNLFITEKLVGAIRSLRGKVQVILVTHNASLAINTDSDNLIIANNENFDITYMSSGLENIDYRDRVCKLLDGGHHTFDQRYHKYDIPSRKIYEPIGKEDF